LLIINPDVNDVVQLMNTFDRPCWKPRRGTIEQSMACGPVWCDCGHERTEHACCVVIQSLSQLHGLNLTHAQVVICATELHDASGLDALAYIRGTRPDLPVILTGADDSIAVEAIRGRALDFMVTGTSHDYHALPLAVEKCLVHQRVYHDNERLQHDLKKSLAELAVTNSQLQLVINQLEQMARTDELTGLSNRRWFNLMLQGSWAEATRHGLPLACLMIDLDSFKQVNDKLGHHHGDELLRLAARVIKANCREVDVPCRYGGDEFCILMAHTEAAEAGMVADRILREFDMAVSVRPSAEPRVSMSIGLSHIGLTRPINAEQLVSHADEAMYAAKFAGKQRVMVRGTDGVHTPRTKLNAA